MRDYLTFYFPIISSFILFLSIFFLLSFFLSFFLHSLSIFLLSFFFLSFYLSYLLTYLLTLFPSYFLSFYLSFFLSFPPSILLIFIQSANSWPRSGQIDMHNVSLRYREGLPLVLDNVTLSIKSKEKIGIVGR